jgi:hypothetical protein
VIRIKTTTIGSGGRCGILRHKFFDIQPTIHHEMMTNCIVIIRIIFLIVIVMQIDVVIDVCCVRDHVIIIVVVVVVVGNDMDAVIDVVDERIMMQ